MPPIIEIQSLSKHFQVPEREKGLREAAKSLVRRKYRTVKAVDEVSFSIQPDEVVGFLGPNGAGKTTTLKMLSGLLHPTGGILKVLGYEPAERQYDYFRQITLVMGNRNQLSWDLPALDSFELQRAIYAIPEDKFTRTLNEFVELLELKDLVHSSGCCEICRPPISTSTYLTLPRRWHNGRQSYLRKDDC